MRKLIHKTNRESKKYDNRYKGLLEWEVSGVKVTAETKKAARRKLGKILHNLNRNSIKGYETT